jgi:hypothetical protein|tara:strand:- start:8640 stop:8762 length:123 start_codon:yes stop_codon:yes gene_type:complete
MNLFSLIPALDVKAVLMTFGSVAGFACLVIGILLGFSPEN